MAIAQGELTLAGRSAQSRHPVWGDSLWAEYEPQQVSLETFDEMRRTDDTVKAALQFIRLTATGHLGKYSHPDPKVQDFVDTALRLMVGTPERLAGQLMSALWAGFAVAELVWDKIREGAWKDRMYLRKVKVLHPLSVWPRGLEHDGKGNVTGIRQFPETADEVRLPKGKFVHWAYDGGFGSFESPYGSSALRACHQWWFAKSLAIKLWAVYVERMATPAIIGFAPQGPIKCPIDGNTEDYSLVMMHMLSSLNTKTEMVFPMPINVQTGVYQAGVPDVKYLAPPTTTADVFQGFIRQADTGIMRGLLVPSLVLAEAEFGTRAQAGVHLDAFMSMLTDVQREIADVLLEQVVRPLLTVNFANLDDFGEWVPTPLTGEDLDVLSNVVYRLATGEVIDTTEERIRKWVEGKFMPDLPEEAAPLGKTG